MLNVAKDMIPQIDDRWQGDIDDESRSLMDSNVISIQHVAGVIDTIEVVRLRKLVFRSTKGQSYMYIQELEHEEDEDPKSVYIIVFWEGARTRTKIENICKSFGQSVDLPPLNEIPSKLQE